MQHFLDRCGSETSRSISLVRKEDRVRLSEHTYHVHTRAKYLSEFTCLNETRRVGTQLWIALDFDFIISLCQFGPRHRLGAALGKEIGIRQINLTHSARRPESV